MALDCAQSAKALADKERKQEKEEYDTMFGDRLGDSSGASAGHIEEGR